MESRIGKEKEELEVPTIRLFSRLVVDLPGGRKAQPLEYYEFIIYTYRNRALGFHFYIKYILVELPYFV